MCVSKRKNKYRHPTLFRFEFTFQSIWAYCTNMGCFVGRAPPVYEYTYVCVRADMDGGKQQQRAYMYIIFSHARIKYCRPTLCVIYLFTRIFFFFFLMELLFILFIFTITPRRPVCKCKCPCPTVHRRRAVHRSYNNREYIVARSPLSKRQGSPLRVLREVAASRPIKLNDRVYLRAYLRMPAYIL